jgi:tetratricopeptide (TPR) repeat protein
MAGLTAVLSLTACSPQQKQPTAPQDKPLAAFQTNLLQTACDVATAIPVIPHIKDRSKMQFAAVTACFKLDQPQRALGCIEKTGDWRRGAGYADYAFYCAQLGFTNAVQHYLNLAEQISLIADQDWRRDRIKVRIAQTHLLLGQTGNAEHFSSNLEKSESGKAEQVGAMVCPEDEFDARLADLDALIATGDFDLTKNALNTCVQFYDRFYDNVLRRTAAEKKVKASWTKIPYNIRIELLSDLAGFSLKHTDVANALRLVNESKVLMDSVIWPVEYHISIMARLAGLRFRCGEMNTAHAELQAALDLFAGKQSEIINIDKADTLIPVAEAFQTMGDTAGALAVYKQAVDAAVENPNNRPRAEDLCSICLSMALNNVEPDEALWKRIKEIQANLGDPW